MGYALQVHTAKSGASTTDAIDTTGVTHLTAFVAYDSGASFSDNKGNTWTGRTEDTPGTGDTYGRWYDCETPVVGAGHTFSLSISYGAIFVQGWTGQASGAFDQENATGAWVNPNTALAAGSVTPTADNELVLFGLALGNDGASPVLDGSTTAVDAHDAVTAVKYGGAVEYTIQTSAGATNPGWSWSSSSRAVSRVATYKAAAGGGGGPRRFFLV